MKKIINILYIIITIFILTSCKNDIKPPVVFDEYTKKETSFSNLSKEYEIKSSKVNLHYLPNEHMPYIDIRDYFLLLDGVYLSKEIEFVGDNDLLQINFMYETEEDEELYQAVIDFNKDNIVVEDLDFFSSYLNETNTNYSEGLVNLEPLYTKGESVTYDLVKYGFKFEFVNDKYLMPLVIVNLIFGQDNYFDLYFNGDKLYGIDTSELEDSTIKEILKSSYNNISVSEEITLMTFNYYAFILDYFYGLKLERNIINSFDYIGKTSFTRGDLSKNIFNLTNKIDDLHTSHITRGYYNNKKLEISYKNSNDGSNITEFYKGLGIVQNEAVKYFGTNILGYIKIPEYEYINNNETLVIYVTSFTVSTPNEIEDIIKTAKPSAKNIVIDLSLNTGGNLGAVLRMFALITNEEIKYHVKNPLNNETVTYRTKGENKAYDDFNYLIKTSSVTFSAANLAASIAKELGIKVIGRKSSGGASGVSFFVAPDGSIINMSSNLVLTNKEYESIEYGIEPDVILNKLYEGLVIE